MSDSEEIRQRLMMLHEAICRCEKCKGSVDYTSLCRICRHREDEIRQLNLLKRERRQ